jgi:MoxR-like ATPase
MEQAVIDNVKSLVGNIEKVIFGKNEVIKQCVTALLARGHVLIEDVPGIGKTTLAQGLARSIDCVFHRIQFTSDMLPADILGISILNQRTNEFEFRRGPIFAGVVLADEINRTPPKSQSALLEAMSEFQVSADGTTHGLPEPFFVLATQNPIEYEGTYTLPESQLDRFALRVDMGYPDSESEMRIMRRRNPKASMEELRPVLTVDDIANLQDRVGQVHVDDSVAEYMLAIIQGTRSNDLIQLGASPRASLELYECCQARALVEGRDFVTPDDVKTMAVPSLAHRILVKSRGNTPASAAEERARAIRETIKSLTVPV